MSLAEKITRAKGGDWHGHQGLIPGPGHSANDRSLSVRDKGVDEVLLHSFAGDPWEPIKDAWRADGTLPPCETLWGGSAALSTSYVYEDETGRPAFRMVRTMRATGKSFHAEHLNDSGGWTKGMNGTAPLLYRLPELLAAHPDELVYIVEGEKDADNLAALGMVATTNPNGAGKWRDTYSAHLKGRECIILADNDAPGRDHAAKVAGSLRASGVDHVVVELPGLPDKGDVSDWLANGGSAAQLADLAQSAWGVPPAPVASAGDGWDTVTADVLAARKFAPVRFIVPDIVPEGLALLAGKPKFGKSFLAMDFAIAVASGGRAMGKIECQPGDVLYCALEDSERRLHDRLHKMLPYGCMMPSRLQFRTDAPRIGTGLVEKLSQWLDAHPDARLIILDTWRCIKPESRGNVSAYDDDASGLHPLQRLASDRPGLAIVVIHHTRKMAADDPFDTISGTHGLTGVADTLMVLAKHGEVAKLAAQGRDLDGYEKALSRDAMTGGWKVEGNASMIGKTSERQSILDTLRDATEPMTAQEIADLIDEPYANVRKRLARMAKAGEVGKAARGRFLYPCPNGPDVPNHADDEGDWDSGTRGTAIRQREGAWRSE